MFQKTLRKPDGRALRLYSRRPIDDGIVATNPPHEPITGTPHLRWHPLRGEWVAYASHRQNRTFLPPKEYSPLAVTRSAEFPTELPAGEYDVAVFENLFASLTEDAQAAPELSIPSRPAHGVCEVIVFTQDADASLAALTAEHVGFVLEVLAERTNEIGRRPGIKYVLPFENRGVEVGVTLHHPHGQIYSYPFVPPVPARMTEIQDRHFMEKGRGLLEDLLAEELRDTRRLIHQESTAAAFVPVCARYPYEAWIVPKRRVGFLHDLDTREIGDLGRALKSVLMKYDGLWQKPMPYLMVVYQAPFDGQAHPGAHAHIEIYPALRSKDRLKFLAGTELGGGMFVNDTWPEEKAAELRAVETEP